MQKVLLIDDEEGIRESLSIMLQIEGFDTVALPDAVKALQLFDTGEYFDFIISDIKMPHMNGIEFLREVRKREMDRNNDHSLWKHRNTRGCYKIRGR